MLIFAWGTLFLIIEILMVDLQPPKQEHCFLDASPAFYQKKLRLLCDKAYKGAIEEFSEKKAAYSNLDTHMGIDFLPIQAQQDNRSRAVELRDLSPLVTRLSRYSPKGWEDLTVSVMDRKRDIHFLSTEQSDIQQTERYSVLHIHGVRKAADGADVVGHRWWVAPSPESFPQKRDSTGDDAPARLACRATKGPL